MAQRDRNDHQGQPDWYSIAAFVRFFLPYRDCWVSWSYTEEPMKDGKLCLSDLCQQT